MYALVRLYGELRGKLITYRQGEEAIHADLARVQAVMDMLEPGFDVSAIKPKFRNTANRWFPKGKGFRMALDVVAKADKPLTIREIALKMFQARGVSNPEREAFRILVSSLSQTFKRWDAQTVLAHRETRPARWSLNEKNGGEWNSAPISRYS